MISYLTEENIYMITKTKKYFDEITIARGIGIVCVVLGYAFPDGETDILNQLSISNYLMSLVYAFHMPLFMLLAGFVFAPKIKETVSFKEIMHKRIMRLIIPYFFYSFIVLCLKIYLLENGFLNQFVNSIKTLIDIFLIWQISLFIANQLKYIVSKYFIRKNKTLSMLLIES